MKISYHLTFKKACYFVISTNCLKYISGESKKNKTKKTCQYYPVRDRVTITDSEVEKKRDERQHGFNGDNHRRVCDEDTKPADRT